MCIHGWTECVEYTTTISSPTHSTTQPTRPHLYTGLLGTRTTPTLPPPCRRRNPFPTNHHQLSYCIRWKQQGQQRKLWMDPSGPRRYISSRRLRCCLRGYYNLLQVRGLWHSLRPSIHSETSSTLQPTYSHIIHHLVV